MESEGQKKLEYWIHLATWKTKDRVVPQMAKPRCEEPKHSHLRLRLRIPPCCISFSSNNLNNEQIITMQIICRRKFYLRTLRLWLWGGLVLKNKTRKTGAFYFAQKRKRIDLVVTQTNYIEIK